MAREARAAYQRRDKEIAQRRNLTDSTAIVGEVPRRGERSWWEAVGVDGAMSPVSEEISNPMEVAMPPGTDEVPSDGTTLRDPATERTISWGDEEDTSVDTIVHNTPTEMETEKAQRPST